MRSSLYLVVFFAALAVRIVNVVLFPLSPEVLLAEDGILYWNGADALLTHGVSGIDQLARLIESSERAPGYILFLAGIRSIFGDSMTTILIVQSILDSVSCVLIASMGAALRSPFAPRLALVAGLLAAVTPNLIIHAGMILSDSLFLFLFVAMLAAGARFIRGGSAYWGALAGVALGLAILTRTLALPLPLLMAPVAFVAMLMNGRRLRAGFGVAILFLGVSLTPAALWMQQNYVEYGAFTLSSQNGAHLAGWLAPLVRRAHDGTPRDEGAAELSAKIQSRMVMDGIDVLSLDRFAKSRAIGGYALEELTTYPVSAFVKAWIAGAAINLGAPAVLLDLRVRTLPHGSFDRTGGGGLVGQIQNFVAAAAPLYTSVAIASFGGMALISLLQLYGLIRLFRNALWPAVLAALCIGYFLMVNGPIGSPKYRLPFEPILILLAGLAIVDLWDRVACFRARRLPTV